MFNNCTIRELISFKGRRQKKTFHNSESTLPKVTTRITKKLHKDQTAKKSFASNTIELSQKKKKFNKNITGEGFRKIKGTMNCYLRLRNIQICLLNKLKQNNKKQSI